MIQKARMSKRIIAGVIDWAFVLIFSFGLYFYPANAIFSKVFRTDELKQQNYDLMVKYNILYLDENNEYQYTESGKDTSNEVYTFYHEDDEYKALRSTENLVTFSELATSTLVSELVFFLIIPLILKNGQTLGKKIQRLYVTDDAYIKIKFLNIFLRFIVIYILGTIASMFTYGIPLVLAFILMCVTKDHRTVHDYLSATRVIEKDMIMFKDPKERIQYDESMALDGESLKIGDK